jgi:hypothetical protein
MKISTHAPQPSEIRDIFSEHFKLEKKLKQNKFKKSNFSSKFKHFIIKQLEVKEFVSI